MNCKTDDIMFMIIVVIIRIITIIMKLFFKDLGSSY
jgi:hypothetical protein